jgi:site-specific DNA recombinase
MSKNKPLRYIAYVRKSSEDKDKQELSHVSQIENIKEHFGNLNIIKWLEPESQSAFHPGRPIFRQAMEMIYKGEADGIVAWYPNRLSRNVIDTAEITYALRMKNLKDLKFCKYNFDNSPDGILQLQNTMNQGEYESSKQGVDVSRGLITKAGTGEKPGRVMPGYKKSPVLDEFGEPVVRDKKIITHTIKDLERYDIVKQMWNWFLNDRITPQQIWHKVNNELHYKTPPYKRRKDGKILGGDPMTKSMVYRIFRSDFYIGKYYHLGEQYEGNYPKMITDEEYQLAQHLLGSKGNKRAVSFDYAYAGMIRCGECNCLVQATHKTKLIKNKDEFVTYVYYYCSRKSMKRPCSQIAYTQLSNIENDIQNELEKYTIIPEFKDLALKILKKHHKIEVQSRGKLYEKLHKTRTELQKQIDDLVGTLQKELIDEDDYRRIRNNLKSELAVIDEQLRSTEKRAENHTDTHEKAFSFAVNAKYHFINGDVGTKRDILRTLGQQLTLKDNKLIIVPNEWLVPISDGYSDVENRYLKVGTNKKAGSKELELALVPIIETWRVIWGSNPGHPA